MCFEFVFLDLIDVMLKVICKFGMGIFVKFELFDEIMECFLRNLLLEFRVCFLR